MHTFRFWKGAIAASLIAAFFGCIAAAEEDTALERLDTSHKGRAWDAVGRLDLGGSGFCTGALIAPDLVLTAAHCLFDTRTKKRIDHEKITFLAGWRNGRASAYRAVRRAVVHPEYDYDGDVSAERVARDIALLELDRPVRSGGIEPFELGRMVETGERVSVVSYAQDRSEAPSIQEVCEVRARQQGILVTTCSVDHGSSGAPIFSFANGRVKIVSVVSAKAESDGERVSLGTSLSEPLATLRHLLNTGAGHQVAPAPSVRRITVGGARGNTGAKFVRP